MKQRQLRSGSCCLYREFYVAFGQTKGWWTKYLKGYTHVLLVEKVDSQYICMDFSTLGCPLFSLNGIPDGLHGRPDFIHFQVKLNRGRHLFKLFPLQTCATLIQTICGFHTGAILANTLFNQLNSQSDAWLKKRGVTILKD